MSAIGQVVVFNASLEGSPVFGLYGPTYSLSVMANGTTVAGQLLNLPFSSNVTTLVVLVSWNTTGFSAGNYAVSGLLTACPRDILCSPQSIYTNSINDGTVQLAAGFTFSVDPNVLSINRKTSGTSTITLASIGRFAGTITITDMITPLARRSPIVTLDSASVTLSPGGSTNVIVTVSTAASTLPGSYTVTVNALGPGQLTTGSIAVIVVK